MDSIKRKAVVPKKATENSDPSSPGGPHLSHQEAGRVSDMENRIVGLEDMLFKTTEQLRESRNQSLGMMTILREVLVHLAAADKGECGGRLDGIRSVVRDRVRGLGVRDLSKLTCVIRGVVITNIFTQPPGDCQNPALACAA